MKKFKILLFGSLLLIPQITRAELAVRPMLPKGNLSYLGTTWGDSYFSRMSWGAPYPMDEGDKRAYADYTIFEGTTSISFEEEYQSIGSSAAAGFDYKLSTGYLSAGINQYSYKNERSIWPESDPDDYERIDDFIARDIALQYVHEVKDETTIGILLINKNFQLENTESTATDKSGQGEVSYLVYSLFSRFKLSELFSLGVSFDAPVNERIELDGDYSDSSYNEGNGTRLNVALGIQNEKFGMEAALHYESEQPETSDGRSLGISLFGEFLIGKSLSLLFKFAQNNEGESEYKGSKSKRWEHTFILYGAKLDTGFGTLAGDIRADLYDNGDDSNSRTYAQISYVLSF